MQGIIQSIANLTRKADEIKAKYGADDWKGHEDMLHLFIRLRAERDAFRYALEMMGLCYTVTEDGKGKVEASNWTRGPLLAD